MMTAMIRAPFKDLMAIQGRMNRIFDTSIPGEGGEEEVEAAAWNSLPSRSRTKS